MGRDVSTEASTTQDAPKEHVVIDQIVAHNIRRWRRAAGLTQEELGHLLGWSAANVSAAERSADPGRDRRRFDAQTLVEVALALSVPMIALILPPEDDGISTRYMFNAMGGDYDMGDLVALVVMTDSDDDSPVMDAYRAAFRAAAGRYLDAEWAEEVASWLRRIEPPELRADRVDRLRSRHAELLAIAAELEDLADAIEHGDASSRSLEGFTPCAQLPQCCVNSPARSGTATAHERRRASFCRAPPFSSLLLRGCARTCHRREAVAALSV